MTVFLSPSMKKYIVSQNSGKSEAEYMAELAKLLEKELKTSGIDVFRSNLGATPAEATICSNDRNIDLHMAFSTLYSPNPAERGIKIYYPSNDSKSRDRARRFSENLKTVYPLPEKVETLPNYCLTELNKTNAPAVFISICNINNQSDEKWLEDNLENLAVAIKHSLN